MDFKFLNVRINRIVLSGIIVFTFFGCAEKEKNNTSNTYYVEMVNFKDTLKKYVSENIFGKVSFFRNNKMELISLNFMTEDFPDMHYYKNIDEINKKEVKPDSKKIRIELAGNYMVDSTAYSIQRFKYSNKEWIKISDMGFINAIETRSNTKELDIRGLGKQIINNVIYSTYK